MARKIAFLIFADFQLLDATGPIAAFEIAERYRPGSYALRLVASKKGAICSSSGMAMQASALGPAAGIDTLIVAGGDGSRGAMHCVKTRAYIQACAQQARRVASVCSGAYLLAAAGVLDGKRATTHWSRSSDFARKFPAVKLEADRIFVKAGKIWSSAGITAGIDLALALIAQDLGEKIARQVAQQLVVYYRRPGGQSQFSALLEMESTDGRFTRLLEHIRSNLQQRLEVADLAELAHMSPRHFSRLFQVEFGMGPAKAVEHLRAETARAAIDSGKHSIDQVARNCGFGSAARMRRSFLRLFGTPPAVLKRQQA
jgi:transcriptional regulator GlxA family with amidase domain